MGHVLRRMASSTGDVGVAAVRGVLVEQGRGGEEWPSRRISSLVVVPVAAARVAPKWRSSCGPDRR